MTYKCVQVITSPFHFGCMLFPMITKVSLPLWRISCLVWFSHRTRWWYGVAGKLSRCSSMRIVYGHQAEYLQCHCQNHRHFLLGLVCCMPFSLPCTGRHFVWDTCRLSILLPLNLSSLLPCQLETQFLSVSQNTANSLHNMIHEQTDLMAWLSSLCQYIVLHLIALAFWSVSHNCLSETFGVSWGSLFRTFLLNKSVAGAPPVVVCGVVR